MALDSAKRRLRWKRLALVCGALIALWLAGCVVIYGEMRKPPEQFGHFMTRLPGPVAFLAFPFETMWTRARVGKLKVGDAAPDFALQKLHEDGRIQLSELDQKQPVVLIFGSYT